MAELLDTLPQQGKVEWIGLRPSRGAPLNIVESVEASCELGLIGDRYSGRSKKRQVTLIQVEHLPAVASMLGRSAVDKRMLGEHMLGEPVLGRASQSKFSLDPELLRRNLAISGVNLLALKGKQFQVGGALLEYTGLCHPCSFMEQTLGAGGYNAMRGHGGITAQVIKGGIIQLGDSVFVSNSILSGQA